MRYSDLVKPILKGINMLDADELGRERQAVHSDSNNPRMRPDELDYEHKTGAAGETLFEDTFGYPLDRRKHKNGDEGFDFVTPIGLIDVKTTGFYPPSLNVKTYEIDREVDYYVLAYKDSRTQLTTFLGWEDHDPMRECPIVQLNYGWCYQKQPHALRSMDSFRIYLFLFEKKRPTLTALLKTGKWPDVLQVYRAFINGKI